MLSLMSVNVCAMALTSFFAVVFCIECDVNLVENGMIENELSSWLLTCNTGYQLTGNNIAVCEEDPLGPVWDPPFGTCVADISDVSGKCPLGYQVQCFDPTASCPVGSHPGSGACPQTYHCCFNGACTCSNDKTNCDKKNPKKCRKCCIPE